MRHRSRRGRLAGIVFAVAGIVGLTAAGLYAVARPPAPTRPAVGSVPGPFTPALSSSPTPSLTRAQPGAVAPADLDQHLDRMRRLHLPGRNTREPLITGDAASQPDLFAAEFVRRLLTQHYDTPRADHLAWVQAESTPTADPLVVGLVPPGLRDRFAVYSVCDTSDGPAPVPSQSEWAALAATHASTTVRIDRVVEPTAWSDAVQAGRVTDPGTTARLVAATLTRRTGSSGHTKTQTFSVAISLDLEGSPTRPDWRFVTAVTYTAIPMGGGS